MKKVFSLLVCCALLLGYAAAEQAVLLPGGRYVIDVPDEMAYSAPEAGDFGVEAYISESLEMDYISYLRTEGAARGMAETLKETAEACAAQGLDVELRKVNDTEMLCFRTVDEADGASCIGYVFEDGDQYIEIDFWYATQEAAEKTAEIISSVRKK